MHSNAFLTLRFSTLSLLCAIEDISVIIASSFYWLHTFHLIENKLMSPFQILVLFKLLLLEKKVCAEKCCLSFFYFVPYFLFVGVWNTCVKKYVNWYNYVMHSFIQTKQSQQYVGWEILWISSSLVVDHLICRFIFCLFNSDASF